MRDAENIDIINFIYILVSFPPVIHQNSIRALEFSKRLVEERIIPIILTQKINKNSQLNYALLNEVPPSLKVYRTFYFESINRYRFFLFFNIFRLAFYIGLIPFFFLKIKKLLKNNNNIKFIYASGPHFYTHIIGYLLKRKSNLPLVVEYRDPWAYNPYNEDDVHWLIKKIDLSIEKKILESADLIITVCPALNKFLKDKFPHIRNKPIFSIANGFNLKKINNHFKKESTKICFTYTGALYKKRSIIPLFKIISELKKEDFFKDLNFKIKIYGKHVYPLEKIINILGIEDLVFLGGQIPRTKALKEVIKSDLAIHVGENLDYPTIAFKVWDYLSCRKKILYLGRDDSYTAKFLKENDLAFIIPINKLEKGKKILRDLINDVRENKVNYTLDEEVLKDFTWDKRTYEFINNVIKKII